MTGRITLTEVSLMEQQVGSSGTRLVMQTYRQLMSGDIDGVRATIETLRTSGFADPEGWYVFAMAFVSAGVRDFSLDLLEQAVKAGYGCATALTDRAVWQPLRGDPRFDRLVAESVIVFSRARRLFDEAGGSLVLRLPATSGLRASTT